MLQWNQDWGTQEQMYLDRIAIGQRAPDQFYEKPEINDGSAYLWQAFIDLGTERQIGMGLGPIPRTAAQVYAREQYGLTGDRFDRFWSIISMMDNEYLRLANATNSDAPQDSDREAKKAKANATPIARKPSGQ